MDKTLDCNQGLNLDDCRKISMSLYVIASALMLATASQSSEPPQDAIQLPQIEVRARANSDPARDFVGRVSAPATNRQLARWRGPVCPGVVNLRAEVAQPVLDRIADVATSLAVPVGRPGCRANLVIVFANDADSVAAAMVENDPRLFRVGVGGLDRGSAALERFRSTDHPIRWWQLSMPVDPRTGKRAARVPSERTGLDIGGRADSVLGAAPIIATMGVSRLTSTTVDALYKTIVVVDVSKVGAVNAGQLGDYLAMIGLAQIDDQAETGGFDTVLNLFTTGAEGLTDWDRAYLSGLYGQERSVASGNAQAGTIAGAMRRQ